MSAADRRIARRRKKIRAQDNRYRLADRSVRLEPDEALVAVRFRDDMPREDWARAAEAVTGLLPFETRREVPGERITLLSVTPTRLGGPGAAAVLAELRARSEVAQALPVFRVGESRVVPTGRAIIRFREGAPIPALLKSHQLVATEPPGVVSPSEAGLSARLSRLTIGLGETPGGIGLGRSFGAVDLGPRAAMGWAGPRGAIERVEPRAALVVAQSADEADVFQTCRELHGQREVLRAEPDFVTFGPLTPAPRASVLPGEQLEAEPYAFRLVRAVQAQAVASARPGIRVAVLDDGIDAGHPDLAGAVVGRLDALRPRSPWSWHGTACAGLIAGRGALGEGVRGVAAGCSLLDVRIGRTENAGASWMTGVAAICQGIEWSWREARADVILLGWTEALESPEIRAAIEEARTKGRDGRGCVIVAAAGDQPGPVAFPGNLPGLLAVAASNAMDEAKSAWTRDGETGWGSAHGPQVGLMAPGVQLLTAGRGGGRIRFGGTAAAASIVAAACALLLSLRPRLTEARLRDLLGMTADAVGQYRYAGGRNDHCGQGRLDLLEALEAAAGLP